MNGHVMEGKKSCVIYANGLSQQFKITLGILKSEVERFNILNLRSDIFLAQLEKKLRHCDLFFFFLSSSEKAGTNK
jgi:hypothetical protein